MASCLRSNINETEVGSGDELGERVLLKWLYPIYLGFMSILVQSIFNISPSSLTNTVHTTTFLVSLCICFLAIVLKLIAATKTPCNTRILNGVSIFTGILSPYSLLSVDFPKWLNWLAFAIICGIVLMMVARDLLRDACIWLFEQVLVPSASSINQRFVILARNLIRIMNRPFVEQGLPISSQT